MKPSALILSLLLASTCSLPAFCQTRNQDHLFQVLDRNGDGELDPYEAFDGFMEIQKEVGNKPITKKSLNKLLTEFQKDQKTEIKEVLEELDSNKDGKTSVEELEDQLDLDIQKLDKNRDGFISAAEAASMKFSESLLSPKEVQAEVIGLFRQFDQDKNGQLTENELKGHAFWKSIVQGDQNGDKKISKNELLGFLLEENRSADFTIRGDIAEMNGVIGPGTPSKVLKLLFKYPNVRTIVMKNVPGSMDDDSNLRAARYIRRFGFTTIIRKDGKIASGGTDFFLAGKNRIVEKGAKLGIHSWGGPGMQGKDLPKSHPQHSLYLKFYKEMGIPAGFYWRTLEAAPVEGIHWMTERELIKYRVRTTGLEKDTKPTKTKGSSAPKQKIELTGEAKMMMALLDLNGNGQLESDELEGDAKEMIGSLDQDGNGNLSAKELQSMSPAKSKIHLKLAKINTFQNVHRIVKLPPSIHPGINRHFKKYTNVLAPNGKPIHLLAMDGWSNERILRVRKVLEHFLRDVPDSRWGNKTILANEMANNHAAMVLLNDSRDMERVVPAIEGTDLQLQDLRANESPFEGEKDYLEHRTRDAAFEEVFHLIHGSGIIHVMKPYDREIRKLAKSAAKRKIWNFDEPNMPGNHFEYVICVYDNYLDLWKTPPTHMEGQRTGRQPEGQSFGGEYHASRRSNISSIDPAGFSMLEKFHPKRITYSAELPASFKGTFSIAGSSLKNQKVKRYFDKAKHLLNVSLTGKNKSSLIGNQHNNRLVGNRGNNVIQGLGGDDSLFGGPGQDVAVFQGPRSQYTLVRNGTLVEVRDSMVNRDGYDVLCGFEKLKFSDKTLSVGEIR